AVLVRLVLITLVIGAALQPDAPSTAFAVRQTGDAAARAIPHARGERGRDDATQPAASSTVKASTAIAYPDGPALPWSPGETSSIDVMVNNDTGATWTAAGAHPVKLGYHWFDMSSQAVVWDGARTALPHDVAPGESLTLTVDMRAPQVEGTYALAWDMVQEGTGWFSTSAVPMREDLVAVEQDGVTFYGKGWGHGIGLSQWGAQGWAEGAAGPRLNGEQIVAKYFPGAQLALQPLSLPFRVLLSAPSTACIARTI